MVLVAEEPVVPEREGVPGDELALAGHAPEALQMEYPVLSAHHVVVLPKGAAAFVALGAEKTHVVLLAVGLPVAHEAGAGLVQEHLTLVALNTNMFNRKGISTLLLN